MKINKILLAALSASVFAACADMDDIKPESGTMLATQVQETTNALPERAEASFNSLFTDLGRPCFVFGTGSSRPDDFSYISKLLSNDFEGADVVLPDDGYNWFSTCGEYSSRNADYANPYARYSAPYNIISSINTFLASLGSEITDPDLVQMAAQARALRAWSYMLLAVDFQFGYTQAADKPSVPLVTEQTTDFTNNPRVTVKELFDYIMSDLEYAVANLEGYTRTTKAYIDLNVAYGIRARVNLYMGKWEEAAADAAKAAEGYTPATVKEVSRPSFYDINMGCIMWGYDMTTDMAQIMNYATAPSWISSFCGEGYGAGTGDYAMINKMLWNKITDSDVRKGWWVDENLKSPNIEGLTWDGKGDLGNLKIENVKEPFKPYTNVKFGSNPIGNTYCDEDFPFMRVEEMILIQAEAYAKSGNTQKAIEILTNFVQTYRDPSYNINARGLTLADEIWFQRRVELWGEGFFMYDLKRLGKPLVRFHDNGKSTNWPDNFRFNMAADDGWLLMRFPQSEMNTNFGIVDNTDGSMPKMDQNPSLRDGVTD